MKQTLFYYCCFLMYAFTYAQILPPIQNFGIEDYNAGSQNWSITQSEEKHIFVGNNNGLLEFNGATWNLYPSPNGTIIRAVHYEDGLVYSGCYMEFGYWSRNSFGHMVYTSLSQSLNLTLINDEHIWNITSRDEWILFQSLDRIYIYNTDDKSIEVIESTVPRAKIFNLKDKIYVQKGEGGMYSIQNGKMILESNHKVFYENFIVGVFEKNGSQLFLTEKGRFYFLDDNEVREWDIEKLDLGPDSFVYCSLKLHDGSFMLGMVSGGYIRLNDEGQILERINQESGLANNTVLTALGDAEGNLWLGLDNGVSVVNLESMFKEYSDSKGQLGAVYTSIEHQGMIYVGSNQGLYAKKIDSGASFQLINGTAGQVWKLRSIGETLFCSHTTGTFIIDAYRARLIFADSGTWDVKRIPGKEHLILQGNYDGFSVLEKSNNTWVFKKRIAGFDISSKSFEFYGKSHLIVNHEFKGLHVLDMDAEFDDLRNVDVIQPVGYDSHVFSYQKKILYASNLGVFELEMETRELKKDSVLSALFYNESDPIYGKLLNEGGSDHLWGFSSKNIVYVTPDNFDGAPTRREISIPGFFRRNQGIIGYENVTKLSDGSFAIGTSKGYSVLNIDKSIELTYDIRINSVQQKFQNLENQPLSIVEDLEFDFEDNSLIIAFSVPNYDKYTEVSYQYQLKGLYNDWSKWMPESSVSLENLPFGTYTFNVRGLVGNQPTDTIASISFVVKRPWYFSNLAIAIYILILFLIMFIINRLYVGYYRNQRSKLIEENQNQLEMTRLEGQQEIMKLRNDRLRTELESKNRELATTAMSLINKNELLQGIKNDLLHLEDDASRKEVAKVIDKNLSNNNDWEFFKEAFNNADKDFLRKVKEKHPSLTPNDLKFCAYLRLNLSSKEIAPLLNISVRSVEIKRYRLRKKLGLQHSDNLIDYILEV